MRICRLLISLSCLLWLPMSYAGQMAIVIDDFGYRHKIESQILMLSPNISISILPDSPHGLEMAKKAYQQDREILIHLPMAPISRQNLERNTLLPSMGQEEIEKIIQRAIKKIPHAKGINNHMGSAMTANSAAMQRVMNVLKQTDYYFIDSMTSAKSKGYQIALASGVPALQRHIFLDHDINLHAIRRQFNIAIDIARKKGFVVVIGHPHPETALILQQEIATLPADITLVTPSALLTQTKKIAEKAHDGTLVDTTDTIAVIELEANEFKKNRLSTEKVKNERIFLNNIDESNTTSVQSLSGQPTKSINTLTHQQKLQMSLSLFPVPIQYLLLQNRKSVLFSKIEPSQNERANLLQSNQSLN